MLKSNAQCSFYSFDMENCMFKVPKNLWFWLNKIIYKTLYKNPIKTTNYAKEDGK